jgi:hypothetical protein
MSRLSALKMEADKSMQQVILHTYPPMKMEQCSETSAYKIQTSGNYPEESIQHSEHGESFKSRKSMQDVDNFIPNWTASGSFKAANL